MYMGIWVVISAAAERENKISVSVFVKASMYKPRARLLASESFIQHLNRLHIRSSVVCVYVVLLLLCV